MPKRRFSKKRRTVRRKRTSFRKKNRNLKISSQMITYMPKTTKNPFPPRYRTRLHSVLTGYSLGAASEYVYGVDQNNIYLPWNIGTAGIYTAWPNPNSTTASLIPVGYVALFSATSPYTHFRVMSSTCRIQLNPSAETILGAIDIDVIILPVITYAQAPSTFSLAEDLPYSKTTFNTSAKGTIHCRNSISTSKLAGVRRRAIEDDLSGAYIGNTTTKPSALQGWAIYVTHINGTALSQFTYKTTVTYDVECWNENAANIEY
nr:MAG: capsid protein [Cressdnaviricota sp.]